MNLTTTIVKAFKSKGLAVSADATRALVRVLETEENVKETLNTILYEVKNRIEKREILKSIIDEDIISSIVADLTSCEEDIAQESTQLLDAFNCPKVEFDDKQKAYRINPTPAYSIHGTAASRAEMFRERFHLVQQRILRSGAFALPGKSSSDTHEVSTISSLLGSRGSKILFGLLTQPEENAWYLEDLDSCVRLDLSNCKWSRQLITEGSLVIVEGIFFDSVFHIKEIGMPMLESRERSLDAMGMEDTFGTAIRPTQRLQLQELEQTAVDAFFVIIADVQLDKPHVMDQLSKVFGGFEQAAESVQTSPLFILMGSFVSRPIRSSNGREITTEAYAALADVIAEFPYLAEHGKFLLVPGPDDAAIDFTLPRRPVPKVFTEALRHKLKNITFASNPCRIRFYTQELLLYRQDLVRRFQRHAVGPIVSPLNEEQDDVCVNMYETLAEGMLRQGHLSALPLHAQPIHWELDHALRLPVLPHTMVLADKTDQHSFDCGGCMVINPGSFSSDCSFVVYRPATKSAELSRLRS